ncbi:pyridoxal 5'-phosphate synthase glutaminase subunit PdxT [Oceanobacillus sp. J11TS1]|uniref:pyridoxal 5'-phosphate synthase glutaminase subunit PdxT n=1 Tax=Oceanobacillus sp. J11TS1 TaxID=2807191 RepID=UPI001B2E59A9|nr:pyridoxal 5'-phosphate synthase glutaminase subunit PdxT [Oceanobacillus sp. J11TS1]GIO24514.1 pyridoxal 5'-phosphate synthase subunit PdxT [Oceanobacillus sp. J11TS1]
MSENNYRVGILSMQGATEEHARHLHDVGHEPILIKNKETLDNVDALIIPGGESTAIWRLMKKNDLIEAIQQFAQRKKPIFGTCAGLVLLGKDQAEAETKDTTKLQLMNIQVQRNGFGRQKDSFEADLDVKGMEEPYPAVFIRAPYIESVGENVEILATYDDKIVAAREDNLLVAAFHPELTDDNRFLDLFLSMVEEKTALPI